MNVQNETLRNLMSDFQLDENTTGELIQLLAEADSRYLRDLRINSNNALSFQNLSKKESALLALATAINEKNKALMATFRKKAEEQGATQQEIADIIACVSLLNINNVFYRFRHFVKKDYYNQTPAGIKMNIMMGPSIGKEFFELVSLAVSALNGCEMCVNSHEESLIKLNTTQARIYDAVRLAALMRGFCAIHF
jgi:lipoyl-dependent peroxiredoxin subunit D